MAVYKGNRNGWHLNSPQSGCCSWAEKCSTAAHCPLGRPPLGCSVHSLCSRCAECRLLTWTQWCHCWATRRSQSQDQHGPLVSPLQLVEAGTTSWLTMSHPMSSRQGGVYHHWQTVIEELRRSNRKRFKWEGKNISSEPGLTHSYF